MLEDEREEHSCGDCNDVNKVLDKYVHTNSYMPPDIIPQNVAAISLDHDY